MVRPELALCSYTDTPALFLLSVIGFALPLIDFNETAETTPLKSLVGVMANPAVDVVVGPNPEDAVCDPMD